MQESRIFKIIDHWLSKGSSTAPELAERFEVSVRTIYRDIDVISSAGIPVYATQGKRTGFDGFTRSDSNRGKQQWRNAD